MKKYEKPFLPIPQQIELLKRRGMVVADEDYAARCLRRIGYYRLSGYIYPFRKSELTPDGAGGFRVKILDDFRDGTELSHAVDLYVFDKKLRLIVLDALERIEVALRTEVALRLGEIDPWAHRKPNRLNPKFSEVPRGKQRSTHADFVAKLDGAALNGKEDFVRHFRDNYRDPLPIWVAVELLDFGGLSFLVSGLRSKDLEAIAAALGIPRFQLLGSWVRVMSSIRNVCAHHSRLWNKPLIAQPKMVKKGEVPIFDHLVADRMAQERLYGALAIVRFFQLATNRNSKWGNRLIEHVSRFPVGPGIAISQAGFPEGWEQLPLWAHEGGKEG